ncbi:MAG: hypothetical protein FRX49_02409 [Trebouxia sp. A1-2]|nr:MAG: hypothetical protein FRX49_02409 [Trebouxia sp. A1-2]
MGKVTLQIQADTRPGTGLGSNEKAHKTGVAAAALLALLLQFSRPEPLVAAPTEQPWPQLPAR